MDVHLGQGGEEMLGSEVNAPGASAGKQRLLVRHGDDSARAAALSARIGPAMDAADIDPAELRDGCVSATKRNNPGRWLHNYGLRDSQRLRQAMVALLATDFDCAPRNPWPMAEGEEIMDGAWLRRQLEANPNASQAGLARALGVDPAAINRALKDRRAFKAKERPTVLQYFRAAARQDTMPSSEVREVQVAGRSGHAVPDIEVRGTAAGSFADSFRFEGGVVDRVPRPAALAHAREIYAIEVVGTSMAPEHKPGDLRLVDPRRHPREGDSVIVHARYSAGQPAQWFIGHFVSRNAKIVAIRKLNPAATVKFEAQYVEAVHKVLTTNEMLGR